MELKENCAIQIVGTVFMYGTLVVTLIRDNDGAFVEVESAPDGYPMQHSGEYPMASEQFEAMSGRILELLPKEDDGDMGYADCFVRVGEIDGEEVGYGDRIAIGSGTCREMCGIVSEVADDDVLRGFMGAN